jgi:hypothetical protein
MSVQLSESQKGIPTLLKLSNKKTWLPISL